MQFKKSIIRLQTASEMEQVMKEKKKNKLKQSQVTLQLLLPLVLSQHLPSEL
jgi:hypothetical protein